MVTRSQGDQGFPFLKIRPVQPIGLLAIVLFFIGCALTLLISPYRNLAMELLSAFMSLVGIFFFIVIDGSYCTLQFYEEQIRVRSYFGLKRLRIQRESILGYEMHQRVDEFNGLHNMIVLVQKNGRKTPFPKIAYSNYDTLQKSFGDQFEFLGYKSLKYAEFFRKTIPVLAISSGILALLVALSKLG